MGHVHSPAFQKLLGHVTSPGYQAQMSRLEQYARGMTDDPFSTRMLEAQKLSGTIPGFDKWLRGSW